MKAFRYRDFRIFWIGALTTNTGSWILNLTVPYVLFQLTQSAVWVGAAVAALFIPQFVFSPFGGSVADQFPRRRVIIVTQLSMGIVAVAIWLSWTMGFRDPWVLLVLTGFLGALNGVNLPSWQGFIYDLVPRDALLSAVTMNSLQFNAARAIGPAIAGVLLATLGVSWAFGLNAATFVVILTALLLIRSGRNAKVQRSGTNVASQLASAIRYVSGQPGIMIALVITFIIGLLGNPVFSLTVVFAGAVFDVGPVELGLMNAALGVGAFVIAPFVAGTRFSPRLSHIAGVGLIVYSLMLMLFALAPTYLVAVVALGVIGACFLAVVAAINTAGQMIVADSFRGRALALRMMVFTVAAPTGGLLQGWLSDAIGPRMAVFLAGILMLLAAVSLLFLRGSVRLARLNDSHDERSPEELARI